MTDVETAGGVTPAQNNNTDETPTIVDGEAFYDAPASFHEALGATDRTLKTMRSYDRPPASTGISCVDGENGGINYYLSRLLWSPFALTASWLRGALNPLFYTWNHASDVFSSEILTILTEEIWNDLVDGWENLKTYATACCIPCCKPITAEDLNGKSHDEQKNLIRGFIDEAYALHNRRSTPGEHIKDTSGKHTIIRNAAPKWKDFMLALIIGAPMGPAGFVTMAIIGPHLIAGLRHTVTKPAVYLRHKEALKAVRHIMRNSQELDPNASPYHAAVRDFLADHPELVEAEAGSAVISSSSSEETTTPAPAPATLPTVEALQQQLTAEKQRADAFEVKALRARLAELEASQNDTGTGVGGSGEPQTKPVSVKDAELVVSSDGSQKSSNRTSTSSMTWNSAKEETVLSSGSSSGDLKTHRQAGGGEAGGSAVAALTAKDAAATAAAISLSSSGGRA